MNTTIRKNQSGDTVTRATASAPGVNDDVSLGYAVGSLWFDTTSNILYSCTDATNGAAVWATVAGSGSGGSGGGTKLAVDTTQVTVTNTTTETDLFSVAIPGGTLGANDAIRFKINISDFGILNNNIQGVILRLKYGASTLVTLNPVGGSDILSGLKGFIEGEIIANNATNAQKAQMSLWTTNSFSESAIDANVRINKTQSSATGTSAIDSTADQNLVISADWDAANVANTITAEAIIVEKVSTGSGGPIDPATQSFLFDDFIGGGVFTTTDASTTIEDWGELGWVASDNADTAAISSGGNTHPGAISCTVPGAGGPGITGVSLQGSIGVLNAPSSTMEFLVKLDSAAHTTAVGITDSSISALTGGVNAKLTIVSNGTVWRGYYNDTTADVTTAGTVATSTNWVKLKIVTNAAGNSAEFFVDGASLGSIALTGTGSGKFVVKAASPNNLINIDYFYFNRELTR